MAVQGSITPNKGYPTHTKNKVYTAGYVTGPSSYVNGTGLTIYEPNMRSIDHVVAGITVSGTYFVVGQPFSAGANSPTSAGAAPKYALRWFLVSNFSEVTNATNLSTETVNVVIFGG